MISILILNLNIFLQIFGLYFSRIINKYHLNLIKCTWKHEFHLSTKQKN